MYIILIILKTIESMRFHIILLQNAVPSKYLHGLWICPGECFHHRPQDEFLPPFPRNQMAHAPSTYLHNPNQVYPMNASNNFQLCQDGCQQLVTETNL